MTDVMSMARVADPPRSGGRHFPRHKAWRAGVAHSRNSFSRYFLEKEFFVYGDFERKIRRRSFTSAVLLFSGWPKPGLQRFCSKSVSFRRFQNEHDSGIRIQVGEFFKLKKKSPVVDYAMRHRFRIFSPMTLVTRQRRFSVWPRGNRNWINCR